MHETGWDNDGYIFNTWRHREGGQCRLMRMTRLSLRQLPARENDTEAFLLVQLWCPNSQKDRITPATYAHTHRDLTEVKSKAYLKHPALKLLCYYLWAQQSDKKQQLRCLPGVVNQIKTEVLSASSPVFTGPTKASLDPRSHKRWLKKTEDWMLSNGTALPEPQRRRSEQC